MNTSTPHNDFEVVIASLPDKENLVSEIYYKDNQWAEISKENGELLIQFYPPFNEKNWQFSFNEAIDALQNAKNRLLELDTIT